MRTYLIKLSHSDFFLFFFFFLIRIPEDILNQEFLQTRALCKFSTEFLGCWTNRIVHTSVMYVSCFTTLAQMGIVNARLIFYEWLNYKKFSLAVSPHHLAKCVICIFAKFGDFHHFGEITKNTKMTFFTHLQIVKNSKKFSYTWFISPRIIYCLVPRQPPYRAIWGGWV